MYGDTGWGSFQPHEIALLIVSPLTSDVKRFQRIGLGIVVLEADAAQEWIESAKQKDFVIL